VTEAPSERESTWDRLRHRKVVQWGLLYVAGAWGFLQGLEYFSESFHWPDQLRPFAIIALLVGLPIVLVVAWYHGDRGEQRIRGTEIAIVALLVFAGGAILWRYERASEGTTAATNPRDEPSGSMDTRPSIAVLPFENRSRLEDDAFFVDGIHDDILTQLSKISALKVISRTSVEQYRNTRLSAREVAQQLGVTRILEGGVQRAGDRVRINVQLIDAAKDEHIWAETYDRELTATNIFAIQSDTATAIAEAMKAKLSKGEKDRIDVVQTQNLAAWEAYQLGRQRMSERTTKALAEARRAFERAISLDPKFAAAYAGLADVLFLQTDYAEADVVPTMLRAQDMLIDALRLNPDLPEALTTQAKFAENDGDFSRAESLYQRAISLAPNYVTAHQWYGGMLAKLGRDVEALQEAKTMVELEPRSTLHRGFYALMLGGMGRFEESDVEFRKLLRLDPASPLPYWGIADLLSRVHGRVGEAIPWLERAAELDPGNPGRQVSVAIAYLDLGAAESASNWLSRATAANPESGSADDASALLQLYYGKFDEAHVLAHRAWQRSPAKPFDPWASRLLRDFYLRSDALSEARGIYADGYPELVGTETPQVVSMNFDAAVDAALVLERTGEHELASRLLQGAESAIRRMPRMGTWGYGITDVRIHATRGSKDLALEALRDAERAGWRGPSWRYYRDLDSNLAGVRGDPRFKAIFADIERDMAEQRAELAKHPKNAKLDLAASE
jgi:TolB-like protein/Tfp pilus assembly protein PilF